MVAEETLEGQTTLWYESVADHLFTWSNIFIQNLIVFLEVAAGYFENWSESFTIGVDFLTESFSQILSSSFTDFQIRLLELLLLILAIHLIAIFFAWRKYSVKITERFFKVSESQLSLTEQLKTAVSELKLPLEHTPRL